MKQSTRRTLWDLGVCLLVLSLLYAGRGWYFATQIGGGYYPTSAMAIDVTALIFLVLAFRALDFGVQRLVRRYPGTQTRRRTILGGVLRFVIVFVLAAPFLMTLSQMHPQRIGCTMAPRDAGMEFEEVTIQSGDYHLAAWHIPAPSPDRPAVLIAHGLGANKQNFLIAAQKVHQLGYHVLLFDFRAHGESDGQLSTLGYREADDVKAAYDWLAARHPRQPIYGLGYSMGGAALVRAAAEHHLFDRIVLDCTFARAETPARVAMAGFFVPDAGCTVWWHVTRFWGRVFSGVDFQDIAPEQAIGSIDKPILLIHGTADTTSPCSEAQCLREQSHGRAQLWLVEGAGHLQALGHPDYQRHLQEFFEGKASQ